MGEMTIRDIDDALMGELRAMADRHRVEPEVLASLLLRSAMRSRPGGRTAGAMAIIAAQPGIAEHDSVDLIREDRER